MNKPIKKKLMTAGLAAMLMLTGCAGTVPSQNPLVNDPELKTELKLEEVAQKEYDADKFDQEYDRYSFEMMAKVASGVEKNCNVMISPASIMMALDMVAAGSKGETLKQLNDLFAKDSDPLEQQAFASELMKRINAAQKIKFVCANAIWTNDTFLKGKINSTYVDYIKKNFDAEFRASQFSPSTHEEINKWVDGKTGHMIPKLLDDPLDPEVAMVLVNAIRFEAQWKTEYKDSQITKKDFRGVDGDTEASMLNSAEKVYFESDKATGFLKQYEGGEYGFLAILPKDEKANANDFISSFTYEDYKNFAGSRQPAAVRAVMPEFKSDFDVSLKGILTSLGVKDVFLLEKADLTGIADPHGKKLYVSKVIHKSHIEVDRKGTKAAAATAITAKVESAAMPVQDLKEVICDRPYAYAIVDLATMKPIFIGTVNKVV